MKLNIHKLNTYFLILLFARLSLSTAYLSAVADRIGWWGPIGSANISWGNFSNFLAAVTYLSPWAHNTLIPILGIGVTILEVILPLFLIIGYQLRLTSLISFLLLIIFALSMTFADGIKSPMNYSVFTAAACSLLIFLCEEMKQQLQAKKRI